MPKDHCHCGKEKDIRAQECRSCGMSRKAKEQWKDPVRRKRILTNIREAGYRRRRIFKDLRPEHFRNKKMDGRIYARYWDGDHKRSIYRYQWTWIQANGSIPGGMVLHHINHDPADDRLENLQLLTDSDHKKLHPLPNKRIVNWCEICGKEFWKTPRKDRPNKYCSPEHYWQALRSTTSA